MSKKFVIIDAMALAYKAYFVFINRPLITTKGEPTSAVFGFLNQLIKILEDTRPDYISVAFDSKEKTFRHEKYKDYKATRSAMPDDMIPQIERIKEIIEALNIPLYILPRYEADDIIGTAVCKAEEQGFESFVVTPDKDFNQLVTDKVKIVRPGKSAEEIVFYDVKKVIDEFGFEPKQMVDYLAIIGDSSDNIPGIAGIGPKTAVPLIQKYGTLEEIYRHIDEIEKPALRKKLEEGEANAFISKELATIHCSVPLDFDFNKAKFVKPDFDKLRNIFLELEFKNLYSRLLNFYSKNGGSETEEITTVTRIEKFDENHVSYNLITTVTDAKKIAARLNKLDMFVFDTETDSLDHFLLKLAGVSFSLKEKEAYYIALNSFENDNNIPDMVKGRLPLSEFIKIFRPVFENKEIKKICQNGKFDISVLRSRGIEVNNFYFDTMLASYVIDPDQKHGMDELSIKYLNYKPIPLSDLIGGKKDPSKIFDVDLNAISNYSCEDAEITLRLYKKLDEIIKRENLSKIAYDIEFPLAPVLEDMEREGRTNAVLIDAVRAGLEDASLPADAVVDFACSRDELAAFVADPKSCDVVIPRGGEQLKDFLIKHSRVPVLAAAGGNCHIYLDASADPEKALAITVNAKTQRPGVCNAAETLLVHREVLPLLAAIGVALRDAGVELRADADAAEALGVPSLPATDEDWSTEYLDLVLAVRTVDSVEEAVDHIETYGTGHSEAIVTEDLGAADTFVRGIGSACVYVNASTRFTDGGEFGFGAEIANSTSRLHARGPIGLADVTTTKYVVHGSGQIRA